MIQVKVCFDPFGNTLTVWFGNPSDEVVIEETGAEIILMKDNNGQVIGVEKLNFTSQPGIVRVQFETLIGVEG